MIYVKIKNGLPVEISTQHQDGDDWQNRWDWASFQEVTRLASYITAMSGKTYVAVDNGNGCSPRYDVQRAPAIGDEVSYGFNSDYYPDGVVVKVSKTLQVTTSTGSTYRRRGNSGSWCKPGGTWSLVMGHIYEQNPHF